jgi:GrpB-like predicted nucleotidyltransferase (UPF0157 family)
VSRRDPSPVASRAFVAEAAEGAAVAAQRLSTEGQACLERAQDEARSRDDNHVGTEHIVLALLADPSTAAADALTSVGITREVFIRQLHPEDKGSPIDDIPMTPRSRMVLALAVSEADELRRRRIGSAELLAGVMRESERWAALRKAGPHHLQKAAAAVGTGFDGIRAALRASTARRKRPRPPEANTVVAYDPAWPTRFNEIRSHLAPVLVGVDATIEHVGSTSVPGLVAKPIIDLDVIVRGERDVDAVIERLESIGYEDEGDLGIPGREALAQVGGSSTLAYHHLYVVVEGTKAHEDHVVFRDHLRSHPGSAAAYAARKLEIAHLMNAESRDAYVEAKVGVVDEILERARHE